MPGIDIAQFKLALTSAKERPREYSKLLQEANLSDRSQRLKNQQAIGQVLKPFLTKAGLDVDKLDKVLAQNQSELRRNFQNQKVDVAKYSSSEQDAFRHAIDLGHEATQHLANRPAVDFPGLSSLVTLTTPFLIWEWHEWGQPSAGYLKNYNIQPLNSYAKILIDIPAYTFFDNNSGSDTRQFSFFFYWANQTGYLAITKVFSVLALNGDCELSANAGILSGDSMNLKLDAYLYPVQYWLPLQPERDLRDLRLQGDPLQHQQALDLTATGGHIFGDAGYATQVFSATPYGLSYGSGSLGGVTIPPGATAIFEINLTATSTWNGNTLPDEIIADFADNNLHYYVGCPLVVLEFLTAPPVMA